VIKRALLQVSGPRGSGKTAFIEALPGASDELILAARCVRDNSLRRSRETAPKNHAELRRYRRAGASGAVLYAFPAGDAGSEAFFETDFMSGYASAVVLEGDNPAGYVDLSVFVASAPARGEALFMRRTRDRAAEKRASAAAMKRVLLEPGGVARLLDAALGGTIAELTRQRPELLERAQATMLEGLAKAERSPPPEPTEHWALADRFAGIEHAQLVVFNIRRASEREAAQRLIAELDRLRKDEDLFNDILGLRASRIPITAVVANLVDADDRGRKKALARVKRALAAPAQSG